MTEGSITGKILEPSGAWTRIDYSNKSTMPKTDENVLVAARHHRGDYVVVGYYDPYFNHFLDSDDNEIYMAYAWMGMPSAPTFPDIPELEHSINAKLEFPEKPA